MRLLAQRRTRHHRHQPEYTWAPLCTVTRAHSVSETAPAFGSRIWEQPAMSDLRSSALLIHRIPRWMAGAGQASRRDRRTSVRTS